MVKYNTKANKSVKICISDSKNAQKLPSQYKFIQNFFLKYITDNQTLVQSRYKNVQKIFCIL